MTGSLGKRPVNGALKDAAMQGDVRVVEDLLRRGAEIDACGLDDDLTPMMVATVYGHTDVARLLIESGANVNAATADGNTPLILAVLGENLETLRLLLDRGAKTAACDENGRTALDYAQARGYVDMLEALKSLEYHEITLEKQNRLKKLSVRPVIARGPRS